LNIDPIQSPEISIQPGDTVDVPFYTIIPDKYSGMKTEITYADFYLSTAAAEPDDQYQKAILLNSINTWDGKVINLRYFIKKDIDFAITYTKAIISGNKNILDTLNETLIPFFTAKIIFNNFVKDLVYSSDPRASAEYVQFPHETLKLKGGDCDDLSVCCSALLESAGIETALVDFKSDSGISHVNILINTNLSPEKAALITANDLKYFIRKNARGEDKIWLPVETTSLTNFDTAWNVGVDKFNKDAIDDLGLIKGKVNIIDIY
jgi:hypothetical protein